MDLHHRLTAYPLYIKNRRGRSLSRNHHFVFTRFTLLQSEYWKTYPEYKEKSVSVLTDEHGDFITDQDGIPLAIEETSEIAPGVLASIDRMMEILSKSLSESEKELYLPIVEYLKTHETIKNADGVKLTGKSAPTVNRYFARLIELDILIPEGENKGRIYRRKPA